MYVFMLICKHILIAVALAKLAAAEYIVTDLDHLIEA